MIIKEENLKIQDEDELIEITLKENEEDHSFGYLFEYDMKNTFIENFFIEDINSEIKKVLKYAKIII